MRYSILAAALGCVIVAAPAYAADPPSRAPAPSPVFTPAPVFSWTGFYVGADLGYAWESLNTTFGPWGNVGSNVAPSGIIGGGYLGYNFQVSPMFVLGLEGDVEGASVRQSRNTLALATLGVGAVGGTFAPFGNNVSLTNNFRASVRARAGVAFNQALWYVTGGVAFANYNATMSWGNAWSETWSTGRTGWTLGTGLEYAFTPNWIGRVEYRFSQFGNFSHFSPLAGYTISQRINDSAIRVGIAYKFGGGYSAPVVAKY